MRFVPRQAVAITGAGLLLLAVAISQFVAIELSLGKLYVGISCFGPYIGWSTLRPHIALSANPVVRPLSLSSFFAGPASYHNTFARHVSIPWWMVAGPAAPALALVWRQQRRRATGQPFPVERVA